MPLKKILLFHFFGKMFLQVKFGIGVMYFVPLIWCCVRWW